MTSAQPLLISGEKVYTLPRAPRALRVNLLRGSFFCLLFSIIFKPEFSRESVVAADSIIYAKAVGGFRYIDLLIIGLALIHVAAAACLRRKSLSIPPPLALPGSAFLICIAVAVEYGVSRGGENFFFDWRGLALGTAMYLVWIFWLQSYEDVKFAARVLLVYMACRICVLYVFFAAGSRDTLLGNAIPVFDGPILSSIVFTALLALSFQDASPKPWHRAGMLCLAAAAGLMVLLCMRRTYWGELGIGVSILLVLGQRHRLRHLTVIATILALAAAVLGSSLLNRLQSFDVTRSDSQFSSGNADHVYDLVDAWAQVRQSPIMGIGLGTSYPTFHIRSWKPESVMVHNAPLHVWLKYGLAGLLCYLWFHLALLWWLYRCASASGAVPRAFVSAAFAYLAAQFTMTLGFAPWPYSELQLTILMSFIIAAAVAANRRSPCSCQV